MRFDNLPFAHFPFDSLSFGTLNGDDMQVVFALLLAFLGTVAFLYSLASQRKPPSSGS